MSVIDRWATHPLLIKAIGSRISDELKKFTEIDRNDVVILFSAHSLPLKVQLYFISITFYLLSLKYMYKTMMLNHILVL